MDPLAQYILKHEPQEICGLPVSPITDEYNNSNYASVIDRFFKRYYYIKETKTTVEPYMVLFHSNRICLIGLAPDHPVFKSGIKAVTFDIGNTDRSQNQVKGKGKKGGMALQHDSSLAIIKGNDDIEYRVPSCIRGKLIEINDRVIKDFDLLSKEGDGYLAIVLPKPEHCEELKTNLLNHEQYKKKMNKVC